MDAAAALKGSHAAASDGGMPAPLAGLLARKKPAEVFWGEVEARGHWPLLCKLMTAMCCLPHANADCERVFSALRLVKSRLRTRLLHSTLQALMRCKLNAAAFGMDSASWQPSQQLLITASGKLSGLWRQKNDKAKQARQARQAAAAAAATAAADDAEIVDVEQVAENDQALQMLQDDSAWGEWMAAHQEELTALLLADDEGVLRSGAVME